VSACPADIDHLDAAGEGGEPHPRARPENQRLAKFGLVERLRAGATTFGRATMSSNRRRSVSVTQPAVARNVTEDTLCYQSVHLIAAWITCQSAQGPLYAINDTDGRFYENGFI
jgi:hypothetical protein